MGSVLGREFAYEMLNAAIGLEEAEVRSGLEQLVEDELLYQRGRGERSRYIFKHALIQDAAYQSLLKRTRQQYHHTVAKLFVEQFRELAQTQPGWWLTTLLKRGPGSKPPTTGSRRQSRRSAARPLTTVNTSPNPRIGVIGRISTLCGAAQFSCLAFSQWPFLPSKY
jgi:hypothetical protein